MPSTLWLSQLRKTGLYKKLEAKHSSLDLVHKNLITSQRRVYAEKQTLQAERDRLLSENTGLSNEVTNLNSETIRLEGLNQDLTKDREQLLKGQSAATQEIEAEKTVRRALEREVSKLKLQKSTLDTDVNHLQKEVSKVSDENMKLHEKNILHKNEIDASTKEQERLCAELDDRDAKLIESNQEQEKLRSEIVAKNATLEESSGKIQELQGKLASQERSHDGIMEQLSTCLSVAFPLNPWDNEVRTNFLKAMVDWSFEPLEFFQDGPRILLKLQLKRLQYMAIIVPIHC